MKMKTDAITREVDELIWQVAESHDPKMEAEFRQRYPQLSAVLADRVRLVGSLRSAKPVAPIATRFAPKRTAKAPKFWLAPLAAGLLIGLAAASYQIVKFVSSEPAEPKATAPIERQSPVPKPTVERELRQVPTGETPPRVAPTVAPEESLASIPVEGATLFGALEAVEQAGIKIQRMPGLEDAPISLSANMDDGTLALPPFEMLKAIQQAAGFEMVDGGPDGYFILPSDRTQKLDNKPARPVEAEGDGN